MIIKKITLITIEKSLKNISMIILIKSPVLVSILILYASIHIIKVNSTDYDLFTLFPLLLFVIILAQIDVILA